MAVLLDLDGTLSDSRPGIAASFRYMLEQMGHDPAVCGDLTWAVGPPIGTSIRMLLEKYGDDRADQGVAIYRARYSDVGIYDCSVYPGVRQTLETLKAAGVAMHIATSKRRDFADRVMEHLDLRGFVGNVYGALPGGGLDEKHDLIEHILKAENLSAKDTWMVGDRLHDVHAAHRNDVRCIGVLWGYGGQAELHQAGANAIVGDPAAIPPIVLG